VDGTQWTSAAMGRVLDQSMLRDDFFGAPPPAPDPTENIVQQLPVLKQGASGVMVRRVQGLLVAAGYDLGTSGPRRDGIDGSWGTATDKALRAAQNAAGIAVDGICGQATWAALLGVA
jgi:peptidoglycan hydrolase-like protein with peptidoglycan-binding domain